MVDSYSTWQVKYLQNNQLKFMNSWTGKYLQINSGGTGGNFTVFKYDSNDKTLQSNSGFYMATNKYSNVVAITKDECKIDNGCFSFQFDLKVLVVEPVLLRSVGCGQYIGCDKNNVYDVVCSDVPNDECYQWEIQYERLEKNKIKLRNVRSNRYLTIDELKYMKMCKHVSDMSKCHVAINGRGALKKRTLFKYDQKRKTIQSMDQSLKGKYLSIKKYEGIFYATTCEPSRRVNENSRFEFIKVNP
eukprot:17000_1